MTSRRDIFKVNDPIDFRSKVLPTDGLDVVGNTEILSIATCFASEKCTGKRTPSAFQCFFRIQNPIYFGQVPGPLLIRLETRLTQVEISVFQRFFQNQNPIYFDRVDGGFLFFCEENIRNYLLEI